MRKFQPSWFFPNNPNCLVCPSPPFTASYITDGTWDDDRAKAVNVLCIQIKIDFATPLSLSLVRDMRARELHIRLHMLHTVHRVQCRVALRRLHMCVQRSEEERAWIPNDFIMPSSDAPLNRHRFSPPPHRAAPVIANEICGLRACVCLCWFWRLAISQIMLPKVEPDAERFFLLSARLNKIIQD